MSLLMSSTLAVCFSKPFHSSLLDELLLYCTTQDASDVTLQPDRRIYAEIHGQLQPVTIDKVEAHKIKQILYNLYGPNALAQLSHSDLDFSYEIKISRKQTQRFRVNVTPILARGAEGYQITFRILPQTIPSVTDLEISQIILDHCQQQHGMILVTGPTGSGKTTLLASLIQHRSTLKQCGKILTYESPIEYVYDDIEAQHGLISQTEIPRHLPDYARAIRNALRRKPAVIVAGEARDAETIIAMMEAALTGHLVLSTTHTQGVAETIPRLLARFPLAEQSIRAYALIDSLKVIISQLLVPSIKGGRIAMREWLYFNDAFKKHLLSMPLEQWSSTLKECLMRQESSFHHAAMIAFDNQQINLETFESYIAEKETLT